jgi:tetratricopeptide (TPR) repeat protein
VTRDLDLNEIHREVGRALEAQGQSLEALRQFMVARDVANVARLTERHSTFWALNGHVDEVLKAHKVIGGDPRSSNGMTMLDETWAAIAAGDLMRARPQAGLARELLGSRASREVRASLDLADGFIAYESGDFSLAGQCAERVLRAQDVTEDQIVAASWLRGTATFRLRDVGALSAVAAEIQQRIPQANDFSAVMVKRMLQAMTYSLQGEVSFALDAANEVLMATERSLPARHFYPVDAWLVRTWSLRVMGRTTEAEQSLAAWEAAPQPQRLSTGPRGVAAHGC